MRLVWGRFDADQTPHEAVGWAQLPAELMRQVLDTLTTKERWSARQISTSWAEAARQTACFEVVITANSSTVLPKARSLRQRQLSLRIPNVRFTLKLLKPVQIAELANLLWQLVSKASHLAPFRLAISLVITNYYSSRKLNTYAASVASSSELLLNSHGIACCISLCTQGCPLIIPTARLLLLLAPFLSNIDLYRVPMEQTTIVEPSWLRYPQFTSVHINALQTSTSLTSLCISDKRQAFEHPATGLAHNMPSVAHFSSLTRLHLSLACGNPVADFQPLSQLSTLEDLALQYHGSPCCCKDVLVSCRQTLRAVILASTGLSDATYQALGQVPCLNRLVIKLWAMNTTQATGFQHLKAKHVHLEIFNFMHTSQMALLFWANRSNVIQVHELTLWCVEDARIGLLTPMPFLRSLNIVASTGFTGSTMQRHSNVTELNLINVPGINSSGLQHMLATALPHVKKVAFLAPHDPGSSVSVTQDILNAIQHGRYLSLVDLRGMTGLTSSHAEQLQSALSRQLRPEQPSLIVKMPYGQLGQHQPVIHAVPNLYLSALHLLPHHSDSLNLEMQLQERPDRPNCLEHSNVAGLDLFFWIGCVLGVCVNMLS